MIQQWLNRIILRSLFFGAFYISLNTVFASTNSCENRKVDDSIESNQDNAEQPNKLYQLSNKTKRRKNKLNKKSAGNSNREGLIALIIVASIISAIGLFLIITWKVSLIFGPLTLGWLGIGLLIIGLILLIITLITLKREKTRS